MILPSEKKAKYKFQKEGKNDFWISKIAKEIVMYNSKYLLHISSQIPVYNTAIHGVNGKEAPAWIVCDVRVTIPIIVTFHFSASKEIPNGNQKTCMRICGWFINSGIARTIRSMS